MKKLTAAEVNKARGTVYTWTDCENGYFTVVYGYNRRTSWLRCQGQSFLVCPDAECVQFDSVEEMRAEEATRRNNLATIRAGR